MGHGWTSVDCDFFLPPLEAPPFIFVFEDNKDPAAADIAVLRPSGRPAVRPSVRPSAVAAVAECSLRF